LQRSLFTRVAPTRISFLCLRAAERCATRLEAERAANAPGWAAAYRAQLSLLKQNCEAAERRYRNAQDRFEVSAVHGARVLCDDIPGWRTSSALVRSESGYTTAGVANYDFGIYVR
jgi:hypothetical protein